MKVISKCRGVRKLPTPQLVTPAGAMSRVGRAHHDCDLSTHPLLAQIIAKALLQVALLTPEAHCTKVSWPVNSYFFSKGGQGLGHQMESRATITGHREPMAEDSRSSAARYVRFQDDRRLRWPAAATEGKSASKIMSFCLRVARLPWSVFAFTGSIIHSISGIFDPHRLILP